MLSRVAGALYVVGRRLERADHLARLTAVHQESALEAGGAGPWIQLAACAGLAVEGSQAELRRATRGAVVAALGAALQEAADAARAVRPSISSETFEQINRLEEMWAREHDPNSHRALRQVQLQVQLVGGLVDDAMARGPERSFIRMGRYLERVGCITTLVVVKLAAGLEADWGPNFWPGVLRCAWSLEAYRMRGYPVPIEGPAVVQALLYDRALPRSAAGAATLVAALSKDLGSRSGAPQRAAEKLAALYQPSPDGLAGLSQRSRRATASVERALGRTFFLPSQILGRLDVADQQQQ